MTTSFSTVIRSLYNLQKFGIKLGLENIQTLLERLGQPHRRYPVLHIAGTNGKGSCAAMATAVLRAAGYRVGLYTSPHLVDFRERIQVNGQFISEEDVVRLYSTIEDSSKGYPASTFFEWTTAMAFQFFANRDVDLAVIEVGMGGRFDATNVVSPLVSVITSIGLDHQQHLGGTLEAIAFEKAGIVKPAVPLIIGSLPQEARQVIQQVACERQAPLYQLGRDFWYEDRGASRVVYHGMPQVFREVRCPLRGRHQLDNAACALAMVEVAGKNGFPVTESSIHLGFRNLQWEGRLEIAQTDPLLVLDGAHNPSAAAVVAAFLEAFRHDHDQAQLVLLIGMMRDKDHRGFLDILGPLADRIVVTEPRLPRAAKIGEFSFLDQKLPGRISYVPDPSDALAFAQTLVSEQDLICVTGSLMLVGDIKAHLRGCQAPLLRE